MDLIEQAARRLEELKRTGADVLDGLVDPRAAEARTDEIVAEHGPGARVASPPPAPARRAGGGAVRTAVPAGESLRCTIDLARLAQRGVATPDAPHTAMAREFRLIKRPVLENARGKAGVRSPNANLVMVTSALAGEGKSFCATNLAMSIAMELDRTVLLVDADVANPVVLDMLGLPPSPGLLDVLTDPACDLSSVILRTNVDKLSVLPAGTRHDRATELLASEGMTRLVDEMASRYADRIIVFDSPPLLLTTEAPVLATHMGQIVVVVEADRTSANAVRQALAKVENCPVVLMLLNKARTAEMSSYYGYGYGQSA